MRCRVIHRTEYAYAEPVPLCHNLIRLRPRDTDRQDCLDHERFIDPAPAELRERIDFFGNHEIWISVQEPHRRLVIEGRSEVETRPARTVEETPGPPWDQVATILAGRCDPDALEARQFRLDSAHVPTATILAEYARPSFPAGAAIVPCVIDLTQRIFHDFIFDPTATTVSTPVLDVLRNRRGVCQDFAHVQIGCLRSIGLAARYVSGYLVTRPPVGRPRLVGADASHAWVSVFVPDLGWLDVDPTNGVLPGVNHITVGWARDYDDVVPVRGVITGGHSHVMRVAVDVEPLGGEMSGSADETDPPSTR